MSLRNSDAIVLSYNRRAMDFLRNEDYKSALTYLTKAEEILDTGSVSSPHKLYGITLNNFGCFYKRTGNPAMALNFLRKALEIGMRPPVDVNNLSGTHLNICAIYSQIEDHHKALSHALKALGLLRPRYSEDPALLTTLLVAHHNAGVEYEFLSQQSDAYQVYRIGWEIANYSLGEGHSLTASLKNSVKNTSHARRNTSVSPLHNTPATPVIRSRGSVPRSYRGSKKSSAKRFDSIFKEKKETARFVTGERLQPMFKQEASVTPRRSWKKRDQRHDVKELIKELNGESSKDVEEFKKKISFERLEKGMGGEESCNETLSKEKTASNALSTEIEGTNETPSKEKTTSIGMSSEREYLNEKVSISTQVDFVDRTVFKNLRNNAASIIQKYCRGFMEKKRKEYDKYSKQLEEAEKQANIAKEKLKALKWKERKIVVPEVIPLNTSVVPEINEELVPIAYKNKFCSPMRTESRPHPITPRKSEHLASIPEEVGANSYKIISIQRHIRGWVVRKEYILKRAAIIRIQRNIKRFLIKKLYSQVREAVICIQRHWRHRRDSRLKILKNGNNNKKGDVRKYKLFK